MGSYGVIYIYIHIEREKAGDARITLSLMSSI